MSPADVSDDTPVPNELPANLFRGGWTIALRFLQRRNDLNGVEGEVYVIYPHYNDWVCVRLETGKYARVRPKNLEILRTGTLPSLGGIVRALRFSRQERTTGARRPTEDERQIVEDLALLAAADSAQEHGFDVTRNVSLARAKLANCTDNEWWAYEFVLVDELVPEWLRVHANAAAGGEVRTVDSALIRKLSANAVAWVENHM